MAYDFTTFKKQIAGVLDWLKREFQQIRTGQASPAILDGIRVDVYGAPMLLKEVASITLEGPRALRVTPWDKAHLKEIEKAVTVANLGLSLVVDDQGVRVLFPELTAERRAAIARSAKDKLEEAKKQLRAHRDAVIKDLQAKEKTGGYGKDDIFRLKNETQKLVDDANSKLEDSFGRKEKEIAG
ncbi:MAG: ribosome-recycling factor [Patescibacteria group bacterium]|nr:ribosome-recycling factor [Patescibacteria group bacterium]